MTDEKHTVGGVPPSAGPVPETQEIENGASPDSAKSDRFDPETLALNILKLDDSKKALVLSALNTIQKTKPKALEQQNTQRHPVSRPSSAKAIIKPSRISEPSRNAIPQILGRRQPSHAQCDDSRFFLVFEPTQWHPILDPIGTALPVIQLNGKQVQFYSLYYNSAGQSETELFTSKQTSVAS